MRIASATSTALGEPGLIFPILRMSKSEEIMAITPAIGAIQNTTGELNVNEVNDCKAMNIAKQKTDVSNAYIFFPKFLLIFSGLTCS
jgi:hypothetical protein